MSPVSRHGVHITNIPTPASPKPCSLVLQALKTDDFAAAIKNHKKYFDDDEDDDDDDVNERNMGTAAAMQALKMFTGHGAADPSSTGGAAAAGKSQFIGLALSEASKVSWRKRALVLTDAHE